MEFLEMAHVNMVRGGRQVLHDVSLRIEEGERVALLGPNGCGKSTLLKVMTCELYPLAQPQTLVKILGRERWDLTELRKHLGVVQNELPGKPTLKTSARDVVLTGFFSSSTLWPNLLVSGEMEYKADAMLETVGVAMLRDRLFGELSAGQQRRILIGRALIASAGCLLLDEPSNALDIYAQGELRELLIELGRQGTTMVHITHHIADIVPTIPRVIMMRDGRIVADGRREELLNETQLSELFGTKVNVVERDGLIHAW